MRIKDKDAAEHTALGQESGHIRPHFIDASIPALGKIFVPEDV
jgi:hypothetical protein